jgi:hypothetical protein
VHCLDVAKRIFEAAEGAGTRGVPWRTVLGRFSLSPRLAVHARPCVLHTADWKFGNLSPLQPTRENSVRTGRLAGSRSVGMVAHPLPWGPPARNAGPSPSVIPRLTLPRLLAGGNADKHNLLVVDCPVSVDNCTGVSHLSRVQGVCKRPEIKLGHRLGSTVHPARQASTRTRMIIHFARPHTPASQITPRETRLWLGGKVCQWQPGHSGSNPDAPLFGVGLAKKSPVKNKKKHACARQRAGRAGFNPADRLSYAHARSSGNDPRARRQGAGAPRPPDSPTPSSAAPTRPELVPSRHGAAATPPVLGRPPAQLNKGSAGGPANVKRRPDRGKSGLASY